MCYAYTGVCVQDMKFYDQTGAGGGGLFTDDHDDDNNTQWTIHGCTGQMIGRLQNVLY